MKKAILFWLLVVGISVVPVIGPPTALATLVIGVLYWVIS